MGVLGMNVEGDAELFATLRDIAFVSKKAFRRVVTRSAGRVKTAARRNAPVDDSNLRSSIRVVAPRTGRFILGTDPAVFIRDVRVGVPYGHLVEFGTGVHHTGTAGRQFTRVRERKGGGKRGSIRFAGALHAPFFPNYQKIAEQEGISLREAFLIARGIFLRGGAPAQPFLFPAWEHERPRYLAELQRELLVDLRRFDHPITAAHLAHLQRAG